MVWGVAKQGAKLDITSNVQNKGVGGGSQIEVFNGEGPERHITSCSEGFIASLQIGFVVFRMHQTPKRGLGG